MVGHDSQSDTDCVVVGASFGGLASAHALATAGLRVTVVERKADPGAKLHTTGIIVKDAVDSMEGSIEVDSQVGVGTTATVRIPLGGVIGFG